MFTLLKQMYEPVSVPSSVITGSKKSFSPISSTLESGTKNCTLSVTKTDLCSLEFAQEVLYTELKVTAIIPLCINEFSHDSLSLLSHMFLA